MAPSASKQQLQRSEEVSEEAFRESVRFATEIGAARERILSAPSNAGPVSIYRSLVEQTLASVERYVGSWHAYLDVDSLHSEPCLRAALNTVSENTKMVAGLCEIGDTLHRTSPDCWTDDMQEAFTVVLERFEDIEESLTILIDGDARAGLKRVLVNAGIDGRMLDHKDAKTRPKAHH